MSEQEKEILKNKIITDLWNSGILHQKINGICFRHGVRKETQINEDIIAETFYYISRYPKDTLIEMSSDVNRLIGLGCRIARLKGFARSTRNPEYPRHSLCYFILFGSTLSTYQKVSSSDYADEKNPFDVIVSEHIPDETLFNKLKEKLSAEESIELELLLDEIAAEHVEFKNKRYSKKRPSKVLKQQQHQYLLKRIKEVIQDLKLNP